MKKYISAFMDYILAIRSINANLLILFLLLFGILLRLLFAMFGGNYDSDSWLIVSQIVNANLNVYEHTSRYNYGPAWFHVLGFLGSLTQGNVFLMMLSISGLLSLIDVGIFLLLYVNYGFRPATFFYLNPITILLTGYHRQFDNIAIFLVLVAMYILDKTKKAAYVASFLSAGFLGLSLVFKHMAVFFIFFLLRDMGSRRYILFLFPLCIFFTSFLFYINANSIDNIIENVFLYSSQENAIIYAPFDFLQFDAVLLSILKKIVMLSLIIISYVFFSTKNLTYTRLFAWYCAVLLLVSPAMANQYMIIAMIYHAIYFNVYGGIYTLIGTLILFFSEHGLGIYLSAHPITGVSHDPWYVLLWGVLLLSFMTNIKKYILYDFNDTY